MRTLRRRARLAAVVLVLTFASACATVPYRYGKGIEMPGTLQLAEGEPQIERGRPVWLVDFLGNLFGIPAKIMLFHWKVDRHHVSPETERALATYLAANDIHNVKVRLNQYAPGREWKRLFRNKSVGAGWRYTIGMVAMVFYTVLPGRIFGGDNYNPYTNTINVYSDLPAITLHEGGHAKDFAQRTWKGTYAFMYVLPFFALYPEALATGDAISYVKAEAMIDREKEAYKLLYPAYGTYIGGSFSDFFVYPAVYFGPVLAGHVVGRVKAARVPAPATPEAAPADNSADRQETGMSQEQ